MRNNSISFADKEAPVTKCPKNINITSDLPVNIYWNSGYATDNVAIESVRFSPSNGSIFQSDTKNRVTMTATDSSGNNASCVMEVFIKGMEEIRCICNVLMNARDRCSGFSLDDY